MTTWRNAYDHQVFTATVADLDLSFWHEDGDIPAGVGFTCDSAALTPSEVESVIKLLQAALGEIRGEPEQLTGATTAHEEASDADTPE